MVALCLWRSRRGDDGGLENANLGDRGGFWRRWTGTPAGPAAPVRSWGGASHRPPVKATGSEKHPAEWKSSPPESAANAAGPESSVWKITT